MGSPEATDVPVHAGTASDLGNSARHLPIFDGLRGFMLVLIMLVHFRSLEQPTPGAWLEQAWHFILDMSLVTLDVFFVLSGFLISRILLDAKGRVGFFRIFYARRMVRIFPLYYGFLLVYFILIPAAAEWARDLDLPLARHVMYWTYTTNLGAGLNDWWDPARAGLNWYPLEDSTGHLWSLALEEQFYFLWPVLVHRLTTLNLRRVCLACMVSAPLIRVALVATLGASSDAAYLLTPARTDGLALGAFLAICAREPEGIHRFARLVGPVAGASFLVLLAIFAVEGHLEIENAVVQTMGLTASVYMAGAIVVSSLLATSGSVWYRVFGNALVRRIGQYSYATYVFHLPLMFSLHRSGAFPRPLQNSGLAVELMYSGTMVVLSLLAGALSWHLYESHWLKLRRLLRYAS